MRMGRNSFNVAYLAIFSTTLLLLMISGEAEADCSSSCSFPGLPGRDGATGPPGRDGRDGLSGAPGSSGGMSDTSCTSSIGHKLPLVVYAAIVKFMVCMRAEVH